MRKASFLLTVSLVVSTSGIWLSNARAQDPPPEPEVNQSLPPTSSDVDQQAAIESALSCTTPQSIDPNNFQESSYTSMSLPTSVEDAQMSTTAQNVGPIDNRSADPVAGSGEFFINKTHLHVPGFGVDYEMTLHYRSRINHQTPIGFGWSHNYARHIEDLNAKGEPDCAGEVYYVSDAMERITFKPNGTTYQPGVVVYKPVTSAPLTLEKHPNDTSLYILKDGSGLTYHFRRSANPGTALLFKIAHPTGHAIFIEWDDSVENGDGGVVTRVTDTAGRVFYYNYEYRTGKLLPKDIPQTGAKADALNAALSKCQPMYDYKCVFDAYAAAEEVKFPLLKCISMQQDCTAPLISFLQTDPDGRLEFDLTSVLDGNGNGPTFSYLIQPEIGNYVPDEQLTSACHSICDTQAIAPEWSCHNLDFCGEKSIQDAAAKACEGIGNRLKVAGTYDLETGQLVDSSYSCQTYATHACSQPGGTCYSQNWYTDHYGHWWRGDKMICPYDDGSIKTSKDLPESLRNAACDGWLADWISYCNSPIPEVQASLDAPFRFGFFTVQVDGHTRTIRDVACNQYILEDAGNEINQSQVCDQYMADCRKEMVENMRADSPTCPGKCFQRCRSEKRAKDSKGHIRFAFGRPQDLNHNLVSVVDGDGRLVVHNTYGVDPFLSSFDRVIEHQETDSVADNKITYSYHELLGEQAMSGAGFVPFLRKQGLSDEEIFASILCLATSGCQLYYAVNPDPEHVTSLDQFGSVDVCPSTCTKWGPVEPPLQYVASGMVPWHVIDPAKSGYLHVDDALFLQPEANGVFSLVGAGQPRPFDAGGTLYSEVLPQGRVSLSSADGGRRLSLEGDPKAIDQLFGPSGLLLLQRAPGGKLLRASDRALLRTAPRNLIEAAHPAPTSPTAGRFVSQGHLEVAPPTSYPAERAASSAARRPSVLMSRLASVAFAQGFPISSAPIVIHRQGRTATIGASAPAGSVVARARTATGSSLSILATEDATRFTVRGAINAIRDETGRIGLVAMRNGDLYAVPAGALSDGTKTPAQSVSRDDAIATRIFTEGMACQSWAIGPSQVVGGAPSEIQLPEHAVVAHDLHGVVRTNYYDKEWRLLRQVNFATNETVDYNYKDGTLKGAQFPSGQRSCQQADYFGKPIEVTELPSPNRPGNAQPKTSRYSYSPAGHLTDRWIDPGLPSESHTHVNRDAWDRVTWIDETVDSQTTLRTTFDYPSVRPHRSPAVFPSLITGPDGGETRITMDASAGGPAATTVDVTGDSPRTLDAKYDSFGRLIESGRANHAGSVQKIEYDAAGLPKLKKVADLLNPGSFLPTTSEFGGSQQLSHVSDPLLDRYYQYDPYDHLTLEIEVPKDNKTARKSTCNHYSLDGLLEYSINPEGIVTSNSYDGSNRLIQIDRGHPANLAAWTSACLNGQRAPGSPKFTRAALSRPESLLRAQTPQRVIQSMVDRSSLVPATDGKPSSPFRATLVGTTVVQAFTSTGDFVANQLPTTGNVIPAIAKFFPNQPPSPSWPSTVPNDDAGVQTVRLLKYLPGGFLVSDTDGSGVGMSVVTDGFGRVIDEMDGDPASVDPKVLIHHWRGYDTRDRLTWEAIVGPNAPAYAKPEAPLAGLQSMVEYKYDAKGRLVLTNTWFFAGGKPVGNDLVTSTTVLYDDVHRTISTKTDQHPPHTVIADQLGRVVSERLPDGTTTTTQYQEKGDGDLQIRTNVGPDGKPIVLTDSYDDRGRLVSTFQGKDELLHQDYDSNGRMKLRRTSQSVTTQFDYDAYSRMIAMKQDASPSPDHVNQFAYDRGDRLVAITVVNAAGAATTAQTLDGLDRIIATQDPLQHVTTRDYYPNSTRVFHTKDAKGTVVTSVYDHAGRLTVQTATPGNGQGLDPKVITRTFTFSPLGAIASATVTSNPPDATNNLRVTIDYDSLGNRIAESSGGFLPIDIAHVYDVFRDSTATVLTAVNGSKLVTLTRGFDELHRLSTISLNQSPIIAYGYDGPRGPTSIRFGQRAIDPQSPKGATAALAYDFRGRRTGIDVTNAGGVIIAEHELLGIDGIPRARRASYGVNGTETFSVFAVDNAARLIKEASHIDTGSFPARELTNADVDGLMLKGERHTFYTLDGLANWLHLSTDGGDSTVKVGAGNEYEAFGNQAIINNESEQMVVVGGDAYVFDGFGQLAEVHSGITTLRFANDALGRRVAETTSMNNQPDATEFVVWDGSEVLAVGSSSAKASEYRLRIGGAGVNSHLALADQMGANGVSYYVHQGTEGSVIALSNDTGIVEGYSYSAFGRTQFLDAKGEVAKDGNGQPLTSSAFANRFLYQGQLYDPVPALYSMRAREYSPMLGRFLSPDLEGFKAGDNPYLFAAGMPLTHTDPLGASSQIAIDDTKMSSEEFKMSTMPSLAPALTCSACFSTADYYNQGMTIDTATGRPLDAFKGFQGPEPELSEWAKERRRAHGIYAIEDLDKPEVIHQMSEQASLAAVGAYVTDAIDSMNPFQKAVFCLNVTLTLASVGAFGINAAIPESGLLVEEGEAAAGNLPRGQIFSGHGYELPGTGPVVPQGTSLTVYVGRGETLSNGAANFLELNQPLPAAANVATRTYLPGETLPNLVLDAPRNLEVFGDPQKVGMRTPIGDLLGPNMGACEWAACRVMPGVPPNWGIGLFGPYQP